jgi:sec-independent protein translocase protein TatA
MPNIGPLELAIVAIIALIIFGPKRLPELGRSLGDGMREFKSSISGEDRDDEDEDDDITVIENGDDEDEDEDHSAEAEPASADESESPETAERTPS